LPWRNVVFSNVVGEFPGSVWDDAIKEIYEGGQTSVARLPRVKN